MTDQPKLWRATITWNDAADKFQTETHETAGESHQVLLEAARAGKIPSDRPYKVAVEELKS